MGQINDIKRINWIDMTKGLVMILTVYSHCGLSLIPILGAWVYGFYMPLFFFVSGILLNLEKYTLSREEAIKFENLKYSHDNYYWLLKRYPKLLTRDKSKLGYTKFKVNKQGQYMNEHEIVEYILSLDDQLKKAYDIYQEYLVSNQIATIDMAEQ